MSIFYQLMFELTQIFGFTGALNLERWFNPFIVTATITPKVGPTDRQIFNSVH